MQCYNFVLNRTYIIYRRWSDDCCLTAITWHMLLACVLIRWRSFSHIEVPIHHRCSCNLQVVNRKNNNNNNNLMIFSMSNIDYHLQTHSIPSLSSARNSPRIRLFILVIKWFQSQLFLMLAQFGRISKLKERRSIFNQPFGINGRPFSHVLFSCHH